MRSLLFVPADSERKLAKGAGAGADALILDLEDSVPAERRALARSMSREFLARPPASGPRIWVRVNDLASGELLADLAAVVPAQPAGLVLPKIRGPEDIVQVTHYLEALEAEHDATPIALLAIVTETPAGLLRIGELLGRMPGRLAALSWGAEDLSAALGAGDPRTSSGEWRPTYQHARTQCLLGAHALEVEAIDTVYVDFRDSAGLAAACATSRHDGFGGRLAIHPDQVSIINAAFTPSATEIAHARRVIQAFAAGAGTVSIDGKMYDRPHLKAAQRLLAAAGTPVPRTAAARTPGGA
ncbi:MAG TPA: CoA ester lyase [Steroidobacteraceae bacterium]|nr:CoA ester lyase [Steroidobacteraceae bacterium]